MKTSRSILESGPIGRIRRNHALEHATLQVMGRYAAGRRLGGYSDAGGFWILGDANNDEIQAASGEALRRLGNGEANLAIHPNCGTNYAATGFVVGLAAWLAMLGNRGGLRRRLERLPNVILFATLVLMLARPLGPALQRKLTTQWQVGDLQVAGIRQYHYGRLVIHRVFTRESSGY